MKIAWCAMCVFDCVFRTKKYIDRKQMSYVDFGEVERCSSSNNNCRVQDVPMPWFGWGGPSFWPSSPSAYMYVPRPTYSPECQSMMATPCNFSVEPDSCHLGVQAAARGAPLPIERDPRKQVAAMMGYTNYMQSCGSYRNWN